MIVVVPIATLPSAEFCQQRTCRHPAAWCTCLTWLGLRAVSVLSAMISAVFFKLMCSWCDDSFRNAFFPTKYINHYCLYVLWLELEKSTNLSINCNFTYFNIIIYLNLLVCFQHKTIMGTKTSKALVDGTPILWKALSALYFWDMHVTSINYCSTTSAR